jgi:hypothetical protein
VAVSAEHFLRRVHVHDGEIAAERARQAARLHDAAHRESLFAFHRAHGDLAVNAEAVIAREGVGDDERIGLR